MAKTEKEQDKFLDEIIDFIDEIDDDGDKAAFAAIIIQTIIRQVTENHLETIGFLYSMITEAQEVFEEECAERRQKEKPLRKLN